MNRLKRKGLISAALILVAAAGCSRAPQPQSAEEILSLSVAAHGGEALSNWKTMTVRGTVVMNDGIPYTAAYLLWAEKPGKLRVEQDMTADRGRLFYEYFLNNGTAWRRNNLIPSRGSVQQMNSILNRCDGIAYYAHNADTLIREKDAVVTWDEDAGNRWTKETKTATRQAYVVTAVIGSDTIELSIDKENFYFLQESSGNTRRIFWHFRKFGVVVLPGAVHEITATRRGERMTPYTYETVIYNEPIEEWLFEEDMPKTARKR